MNQSENIIVARTLFFYTLRGGGTQACRAFSVIVLQMQTTPDRVPVMDGIYSSIPSKPERLGIMHTYLFPV